MPKWIPEGWHSVTPRLVVHDPPRLVQFLRQAFGATGDLRTEMPSVMKIGDSLVMVSGVGARDATPGFLYLYVDGRSFWRRVASDQHPPRLVKGTGPRIP